MPPLLPSLSRQESEKLIGSTQGMGDVRGQLLEELRSLLPSPPTTPDARTSPGHGGAAHHSINIYPNPTSRLLESGEAELHLKQVEQQRQLKRMRQEAAATGVRRRGVEVVRSLGIRYTEEASGAGAAGGGDGGGGDGGSGAIPCDAAGCSAGPSSLHRRLQEEAQSLARGRAGTPDFQACRGGPHGRTALCATHSHGRCFRLHWCCLLGWCHCRYVYRAFTPLEQLPSTAVPARPGDAAHGRSLVQSSAAAAAAAAAGEAARPGSTPARRVGGGGDCEYPRSMARRPKPGEVIHSVETVV